MSEAVKGVLAAVTFRPINADGTPDQYEKTHRVDITVNGIKYGCGSVKPSPRGELQLRVQAGKDWVTLEPGDTVQFFTKSRDYNGKTYYDKEGKIMLVAKGTGQAAPSVVTPAAQPAQRSAPTAAPGATVAPSRDLMQERITSGMYLNNAVALIAAGQFKLQDGAKAVVYVKHLHGIASGNGPSGLPQLPDGSVAQPAVRPAAVQQPAPAAVQQDYPEDDITF